MTETFGQQSSFAKGTLVNASRTVPRAGLGRRSRAVRPNAQSSTSAPALCHSSVHENTKAPAHPGEKVLRSCHSSACACVASPFRRLSSPISLINKGRSPAILRSEEHTSELQSLRHLVCRLL